MMNIPMNFDLNRMATSFTPTTPNLRYRFGEVVSIESDHTCTVTIGGDSTNIASVRYLTTPKPGAVCILAVDGLDIFLVGHLGAGDGTISPRANRSTTQSIADNNDVAVDFDGVNSDPWGCWSSGASTRLTAPITGRYVATANVQFAANGSGNRSAWIERNGTSTIVRVQHAPVTGSPTYLNLTAPAFDMTKGDYIRLLVRQTSGGALTLNQSSTYSPCLSLIYVGP